MCVRQMDTLLALPAVMTSFSKGDLRFIQIWPKETYARTLDRETHRSPPLTPPGFLILLGCDVKDLEAAGSGSAPMLPSSARQEPKEAMLFLEHPHEW